MSWCDKLASRPTVGFTFDKHFRPSGDLLQAVVPVLDKLAGPIADKFTLAKQDAFSIEFITENGFKYTMDAAKVAVEFQHRFKIKNTSGGMPVTELLSLQDAYTTLLQDVSAKALDIADLLISPQRVLQRVGVVSSTVVSEEDVPPGLLRGIKYFKKPWDSDVPFYNIHIVSTLSNTKEWEDRCIHVIAKPESDEGLVNLTFDYQRIFKVHKDKSSLRSTLSGVQDATLEYLEELAQGDMFN